MNVLVTGASGFLGTAFVPKLVERGSTVLALSRHPPEASEGIIPVFGDVTKPNLDLQDFPWRISTVYHLAAVHRLGDDKDGSIWETNVIGTQRIIEFCLHHNVKHLYFCSTAYTIGDGRNTYERSKILCEKLVKESGIPKVTVFKPSIIMGTAEHPYPGHFSQFVTGIVKVHQRMEIIRRKIEGTLRLPVLEPVFRVEGNAGGYLNLVMVDEVAEAMDRIRRTGTYWLTNPNPPTLGQLFEWIGEFIMVRLKWAVGFKHMPLELLFQKKSAAFRPYLFGDNFPSHIQNHPQVTREFIHETIAHTLFG